MLYRICGTAIVDRESVDASLKGSTGKRSAIVRKGSNDLINELNYDNGSANEGSLN